MSSATVETKEPSVGVDKRIDILGYGDELAKQYLSDLRSTIKLKMVDQGYDVLGARLFEGKLATSTDKSIDARRFYKLFKSGGMSEKDFLSAISVSRTEAGKILAPKVLANVTDEQPGSPRLTIVRKQGVEVKLIDALEGIRGSMHE